MGNEEGGFALKGGGGEGKHPNTNVGEHTGEGQLLPLWMIQFMDSPRGKLAQLRGLLVPKEHILT